MAIYRILQNMPLSPEDVGRLAAAYEVTLKALDLADRSDPITELVARKIIEIGQTAIRDPLEISRRAVADLGPPPKLAAPADLQPFMTC